MHEGLLRFTIYNRSTPPPHLLLFSLQRYILTPNTKMISEVKHCPESSSTQPFVYSDTPSTISSLATKESQTTISAPYSKAQAACGSHSGQAGSGCTGQNTPECTAPSGTGNDAGGPSKSPMKRVGESKDGDEGNSKKQKKLLNEPLYTDVHQNIIYELNQQLPGRNGANTGMGKHLNDSCTSQAKISEEISAQGENVGKVRTWDDTNHKPRPNNKVTDDMATNIDCMYQNSEVVMISQYQRISQVKIIC